MTEVLDREAQAQLVQQLKALPDSDRREALEEFEEIYGRSRAESLRKEMQVQLAIPLKHKQVEVIDMDTSDDAPL